MVSNWSKIILISILVNVACSANKAISKDQSVDPISSSISALTTDNPEKPKLIVGITVDQMRYDYIGRYWDRYGEGGIKRLVGDGYFFENGHFDYRPTYTGPGHASVYTGTTPAVHGIIGNNWYDKYNDVSVYCAQDTSVRTVGSDSEAGYMSPRRMLTSTITDQVKISTNMKGKTIGIAIKDRGAILPAGHTADAAYWFDRMTGDWITSTYYMEELPTWVQKFNKERVVDQYISSGWNTLYPIDSYSASLPDNTPFERPFQLGETPTFPYDLSKYVKKDNFEVINKTPHGNSMTTDIAIRAIAKEELGADEHTDFLTVSYSSTDYVGHQFGNRAIETEDTYLRLDQDFKRLLDYLDETVGEGEYMVFLTADHGAAEVPLYLQNIEIPAGYFNGEKFKDDLRNMVQFKFGKTDWIKDISNDQIFLNNPIISAQRKDRDEMIAFIRDFCLRFEGIANVVTAEELLSGYFLNNRNLHLTQRGYNQKRSGDISLILEPGWMTYFRQGTTHGTSYSYDTHVPILFYGKNIKSGSSFTPMAVTDIAPSIAAMLHIALPNGSSGKIVTEMIED